MTTNLRIFLVPLLLVLCFSSSPSSSAATSVYDDFVQCFKTHPNSSATQVVIPQNAPSFTSTLRAYIRNARFNLTTTPKPVLIVTPTTVSHVQASLLCAKKLALQLKIRSGGHDYEGISYVSDRTFVIIDMFNFRAIDINTGDSTAWVQTGATLGELYYAISQKSNVLGFPAGVCPTVGVGGHLSGGGYGNMLRKFGLAVDNVLDAQIVDVNGRLLDRKAMGEDLFWAINGGGGGSFGVIVSYKLKLVPVPETVTVFRVMRHLDENATDVVLKWQQVAPTTDDGLFMRMLIQPVTKNKQRTVRVSIVAEFLGGANKVVSILGKEFPELGLKKEDCLEMSWIRSAMWWNDDETFNVSKPEILAERNLDMASFGKRKSDYVQTPISRQGLESLWSKMIEIGKTGLVFNPYGGMMARIPAEALPFPHRAGNLFKVQYSVNWDDGSDAAIKDFLNQSRELHDFMTPFVSKNPRSAFLNYRDLDIGVNNFGADSYEQGKVYGTMYFNGNFDRLVKIKTAVDPENFFRNEQSIPVLPSETSGSSSNISMGEASRLIKLTYVFGIIISC